MTVATTTPEASTPALVLDISEACQALHCGRTTIYELLNAGEITGIRIGRRRLVTFESVSAFVARKAAEEVAI